MATVNIHEAKTHLSKLIERASSGEEIVIAKAGRPVAKLTRYSGPRKDRVPGIDEGKGVIIHEDFDDPLPEFEEYM